MESIVTSAYAVHFKQTAFNTLNAHLETANYSKIFVLVDANTRECCLPYFKTQLAPNLSFHLLEMSAGELHKNINSCIELWEALSDNDADRKSVLINLGGGVVTDLGGFVASTFKRGIDFINIPTTLLAMVDASVGGKTGVDLGSLKNQVGVINQPQMVLVIPQFLQTLAQQELHSGFAEMLKHGLIQDAAYWEELQKRKDFDAIEHSIYRSIQIKNTVVLQDPTEQHLRKILNFGHTLGHAIESYLLESTMHQSLLHGEAIAIGMVLEAYLSHILVGLTATELSEIKTVFKNRYNPVKFSAKDFEAIVELLKYDKKNSHGVVKFVLLEAIGKPKIDMEVPLELFEKAFAYYME